MIVIVFPPSLAAGVYVKANGEVVTDVWSKVPGPFEVIVTEVALPPKLFPLTVTAVVPHVVPPVAPIVSVGALTQPHDVVKMPVVVTQPSAFLTAI